MCKSMSPPVEPVGVHLPSLDGPVSPRNCEGRPCELAIDIPDRFADIAPPVVKRESANCASFAKMRMNRYRQHSLCAAVGLGKDSPTLCYKPQPRFSDSDFELPRGRSQPLPPATAKPAATKQWHQQRRSLDTAAKLEAALR